MEMYLALNVALVLFIMLANFADLHPGLRPVVYVLLGIGGLCLCGAGVLALGLGWLSGVVPGTAPVAGGIELVGVLGGVMLLVAGILGGAILLPGVRRKIALLLDVEPDSCVHTTALTLVTYCGVFSVLQALAWTELSASLPPSIAVTPLDLAASSIFMLVVAFTGVGFLVRRSPRETAIRLGLRKLKWKHLLLVAVVILAFLAMDVATGWLWQSLDPEGFELAQEATGQLFGALLTPVGALAVGIAAGTGEEILFRGALQPRFGILFTALLFTLAHFQYAFSPAMVEVLVLGLALGYMRRRVGTVPCILVHAGYNLADMLLQMLAGGGV